LRSGHITFRGLEGTDELSPLKAQSILLYCRLITLKPGSGPVTVTYQQDLGDGVWKYDVVLRDGKTDVRAVDPMTVGKGG
jgi:hypothetical protein